MRDGGLPTDTSKGEPTTGIPRGETPVDTSKRDPAAGMPKGDSPADTLKALTPARYLAWLYSTDAQKPVLAALLEIEAEIASGLRPGIEHHVAHARLQWWSEEATRYAEGVPVHPLARELLKARANAGVGGRADIAAGSPMGIAGSVDTAVWDLASATFETRKELTAYCERWAAAMFETAAGAVTPGGQPAADQLPQAKPPGTVATAAVSPSPWKNLGAAVREVELLTDLARDAHIGRIRIPLDELDRAGVDANSLAKLPWPVPLATLLKERHEALRVIIASNVAAFAPDEQMALRGLLVWVALTWRLSVRAERALPNGIPPRRYDALADGWQAWRAARRAAAGKLRLD
jgi:15-cis-phytoene synthase